MEFPKSSYVVTVDLWFLKEDGTKQPSRGVFGVYASSAAEALELHKEVTLSAPRSYDWEDVQIVSVMTSTENNMLEYGEKADRAYRAGRWDGM